MTEETAALPAVFSLRKCFAYDKINACISFLEQRIKDKWRPGMSFSLSLNGTWIIDYLSDQPYLQKTEPPLCPDADTASPCRVPGYWEDMTDVFRSTALHTRLHWNPLYTLQRYPQTGYVPDMALPNPVGCFVYQKKIHPGGRA